jgi:uncharacterized membrane protein YoaK (UPF0700 family)
MKARETAVIHLSFVVGMACGIAAFLAVQGYAFLALIGASAVAAYWLGAARSQECVQRVGRSGIRFR